MPMKVSDYPADWRAISQRVRFERAGGQCEWAVRGVERCGARHGTLIHRWRPDRETFQPCEPPRPGCVGPNADWAVAVRVVLTTAHTCACDPLCGDETHLLALCQWHHNRLDMPMRQRHAAATRARRRSALLPARDARAGAAG